jgi:hypothetical protein
LNWIFKGSKEEEKYRESISYLFNSAIKVDCKKGSGSSTLAVLDSSSTLESEGGLSAGWDGYRIQIKFADFMLCLFSQQSLLEFFERKHRIIYFYEF